MLELENLACGYFDKAVLTGVDLQVQQGEIVAVVGPNGVGKSTLIKAACGSLIPMVGSVRIAGQELGRLSASRRSKKVSVVAQALNLPEAFTAMDVVLMGRTPYLNWFERENQKDIDIALAALERTETAKLASRRIGELSGGEQQRVLIARALAQSTPVMLFDEPTAHLDLRHQERLLNLIKSLCHDEKFAILVTLHDLNLVARLASRVVLLSDGGIHSVGPPGDVLRPDTLADVYGIQIHVMTHPLNGSPLILPKD